MLHRILLLVTIGSLCFAQCSLDTVRGTWAYYSQGTLMMPGPGNTAPVAVPFVGLGLQRIDYGGRFTVAGTINAGGQVQNVKVTGTISVNPDCTASDVYTLPGVPGQRSDRLVILDGGNEMMMMGTNPGSAGFASYRRLSASEPQCTTGMIHGVYAGALNGVVLMPPPGQSQPAPFPFLQIGVVTWDYAGKATGATTINAGGNLVNYVYPEMQLTVNADCTGSVKWKAGPKGSSQFGSGANDVVVLNNGDEVLLIPTANPGGPAIAVGRFKRISTLPVPPNW